MTFSGPTWISAPPCSSPVRSPAAIARSRSNGYTANSTRCEANPSETRLGQASAFQPMSKSTIPVTPRAAACSPARRTAASARAGSTAFNRREISKASSSRSTPSAAVSPSRRRAAEFSQTLCTSALIRYVGVAPVARSSSSRAGASAHRASRNPAPTTRPSGDRGAPCTRLAASTADAALPSGMRSEARAHCTACTWLSQSPGIAHAPSASRISPRGRRAPAGAMSRMRPSPSRMSTGSSSMRNSRPGPAIRAPLIVPISAPVTAAPRRWRRARAASPWRAPAERRGPRPRARR